MLKQRVITASILAVLVVWGVLALPTDWFGGLLAAIVLLGAWEWSALAGFTAVPARTAYSALILFLILLSWHWLEHSLFLWTVLLIAGLYWCLALFWLGYYASHPDRHDSRLVRALAGCLLLVAPWVALTALHGHSAFGPPYVLFLLFLIWIADTGAYFAGRRWGRHKLALHISPGKTWEGAFGAAAATLAFALIAAPLFGLAAGQSLGFILLCMLTVVFSIEGDLFESMSKRQQGVKDSGTLLPGHGGVLDRVDSLTAAAPIFALGLFWLQHL